MHIRVLCMVIPTKVDTSQVSQQNVNWVSTVKTQISKPTIQKTHLYHQYYSLNNTCFSGCKVSKQDMTKKTLGLWSECFLNWNYNFPFKNTLIVIFNKKKSYSNQDYFATLQMKWRIMESSLPKGKHWNNAYTCIMHGHPNQSGHITSFTAKCKLGVNSEDQDK